ncbi:hypothetical protein F5887DRAFT_840774, partial [Amanita rubescens]
AIPLITCRMQCSAQMDGVCICDENDYLLLVQTDKQLQYLEDPAPQLIAEAIATYQQNNFIHSDRVLLHIPIFNEITFPGITFVRTSPTFYKIKITTKLNKTVMGGIFLADPVIIYHHTPQLPCCNSEGMSPLENCA